MSLQSRKGHVSSAFQGCLVKPAFVRLGEPWCEWLLSCLEESSVLHWWVIITVLGHFLCSKTVQFDTDLHIEETKNCPRMNGTIQKCQLRQIGFWFCVLRRLESFFLGQWAGSRGTVAAVLRNNCKQEHYCASSLCNYHVHHIWNVQICSFVSLFVRHLSRMPRQLVT